MKFIVSKLYRTGAILWRIRRKCNKVIIHTFLPFIVKKQNYGLELQRLGTYYGGWTIPANLINEQSICYCVGVGVDASFDFALSDIYKCKVFSFDPTPKAIAYMGRKQHDQNSLKFLTIGLWSEDAELRFFAPANPAETPHSVFDLHGTGKYFLAQCRKLSSIMCELGHELCSKDLLSTNYHSTCGMLVPNLVENE